MNLQGDGEFHQALPPAVARVSAFLTERGVWHQLGRNPEVRSCRDAANKRTRLGVTGIPLWDELKSFFGVVERTDGHPQYLVVHCRGDRLVDLERVAKAVNSRSLPRRLDGGALEGLGMAYGLVNPFEPWSFDGQLLAAGVLQVFDKDLLKPIGTPGTVMTNAGDLTWSVELRAGDLLKALDHVLPADVSSEDPAEPPRPAWAKSPTTFGLITGNGPDSGMLLWRTINRIVRAELGADARSDLSGDLAMPRVLVQSLPELGLTMELDRRHEAVWPALKEATAELCRDGATVVAVACNTTPYFTPDLRRICEEYGAHFVSMPEVAGQWLREEGIEEVALLGVQTVADLGAWSPYREPLAGVRVEVPGPATMERIHELAYRVKSEGPSHAALTRLRQLLASEVRTETVLLALTELSLLMEIQKKPSKSGRLIVDTMQLYAKALAAKYFGASLKQSITTLPQRK